MARTKQTARKSSGGKAPRRMLMATNAQQFRQFMTSRQQATYATASTSSAKEQKTSYLNYENMFYSYSFPTGAAATVPFDPRFTAGGGKSPISGEPEKWVGMSFNSMYDGAGMKVHGRPHLNLAVVLDISGSMSGSFDQDHSFGAGTGPSKLDVAKECLESLTKQLKPDDHFGLVRFNQNAEVHCPMKRWSGVNAGKLRREIGNLRAYGATCLTAAVDCATEMFRSVGESNNASNRVIFLTDLCSTVDSVNDERKLLETIKANADRGIYTTVVGIGMDLNVRLVEEISKTRGAKYCSVDSGDEFKRITNQEFDYDVTILAFNIRVQLLTPEYYLVRGYGSPELNDLKQDKPVVISSEFPSWQDEKGESKGGVFLFKLGLKKGKKNPPNQIKIKVTWEDLTGVDRSKTCTVKLGDTFQDAGARKAALLVHYVDLHNDYVHDRRQHKMKFLELFQTFRSHFVEELADMKDKSLATYNKGDLELLDKIIELESKPGSPQQPLGSTFGAGPSFIPGSVFGAPGPSSIFGTAFGGFSTPPPPLGPPGHVTFRVSRSAPAPKRLQKGRRPPPQKTAARVTPKRQPKKSEPQKTPASTTPVRRSRRLASQPVDSSPIQTRKRKSPSAEGTSPAKRLRVQPPKKTTGNKQSSVVSTRKKQSATGKQKPVQRASQRARASKRLTSRK